MSSIITYSTWSKDQDLVLTSLGDYGYEVWVDLDDESFNLLIAGFDVTPPIASGYAIPEVTLPADITINSSVLWSRDYIKMGAEFKANQVTSTVPDGILDVQFFSAIKGHYNSILWDFGDGHTSDISDPYHKYIQTDPEESDKYFTVSLVVDGLSGKAEVTKVDYIKLIGKV